jgi:transcription elongation GreA/GreB family factor
VSIHSPISRVLIGKRVDDEVEFSSPQGTRYLYILKIEYPDD